MSPAPVTGRATIALLAAACIAAPAMATGCAAFGGDRSGIVVTTNILGDVTRTIVGDQAEVTVLMKPNADPHSFGISARQAAGLEEAELVVYNGLGLEEEVLRNVTAAEEAGTPTLAVGENVAPIDYTEGDSAGEPDPHFWTDPLRMAEAVAHIADTVVEQVDGAVEERIRANAAEYRSRVEELHEEAAARFADIPRSAATSSPTTTCSATSPSATTSTSSVRWCPAEPPWPHRAART